MDSSTLLKEESVICVGSLHWWTLLGPVIIGLLVALLALMISGPIAFLIAAILIIYPVLKYKTNKLILTSKRVMWKTGVVFQKSADILLAKVEGVSIERSLIGKVFGYGDVVVRGIGAGREVISGIAAPDHFCKSVHEEIEKEGSK